MPNLRDVIDSRFGVRTEAAVNREGDTVGTTQQTILAANPRRLAATIVNLGAAAIYLSPDSTVSASRGVRIAPSGGTFGLVFDEDFDLVAYPWVAIADAAGTPVFVVEVLAL